ncbi:AraC-type DNA-binding protein [Mucilaginibacter gossypiicola]|uniref:AraC-type DNA-binding protein n=1 Tax=Mucilaginibacter gossypiicola TaxID=551995 RepID=A0A1H8B950_9SPHI|nr:helix-turn-helix transcriptional regulator [Mucilaginibacter gossypiicola]SEM78568.1 AraC-type DNA-binding protein [Mucilaginibacter gossypiicola]
MIRFDFFKNKYGKELLIDCFNVAEIAHRSLSLQELHATSFYEMFFFKEVAGHILLEDIKLELVGPVALLLPPAQPRQWHLQGSPEGMVVIFEGEFMEAFLKDNYFLNRLYYFGNYDASATLPLKEEETNILLELSKNIKNEIDLLATDSYHLLRAYLYQLLILVNRSYTDHYQLKGNLYRNIEILKFRELLRQNIRMVQTVKQYADLLGINRNRLNHLCQETFGKNALAIIHDELLKSCKGDLLTTGKTISEISYEHNFSAPSNFVRFFKSLTKQSPTSYRQEYAN